MNTGTSAAALSREGTTEDRRRPAPPDPERAAIEYPYFLEYARRIDRERPGYLASMGMTAEEYAHEMCGPSLTIDESVAAGWMSPAEGRFIDGKATPEDLLELGYSDEEARAILVDQQERACASSS
jgi:hypothetical protein